MPLINMLICGTLPYLVQSWVLSSAELAHQTWCNPGQRSRAEHPCMTDYRINPRNKHTLHRMCASQARVASGFTHAVVNFMRVRSCSDHRVVRLLSRATLPPRKQTWQQQLWSLQAPSGRT
jgi:hypothetical protein